MKVITTTVLGVEEFGTNIFLNGRLNKMFNLKNIEKGFTLVEVILSMAILSIIAASFFAVFSTSFVSIFSSGDKSEAISLSAKNLEYLYANQPFESGNALALYLDGNRVEDDSELFVYDGSDFNYLITEYTPVDGVVGFRVRIVSFYQDGERYVKLTSFFRRG